MRALHELGALEAARAIADGRITAESLVHACLARIAEREPAVRAWAALDRDVALAAARERDRGASRGPLHGVPIAAKDIMDTAALPTEYGSPIYAGHRPPRDAACLALAQAAGAVLLGKTVTTEFATVFPGATRHPLDPARTPGGSSSGSAAAVADCMVPLATGTQTAGSGIRPAAYCGIVGYKPTFGFVPRAGTWMTSDSLDTICTFGRSIDDAALFAAAASGVAPSVLLGDAHAGALRVGLYRGAEWTHADAATVAAVEGAFAALGRAGCAVREVPDIPEAGRLATAHWDILTFETARAFEHERVHHADRLSPVLRGLVDSGRALDHAAYAASLATAARARDAMDRVFDGVDVLVTAAAPGEAPPGHASTGDPILNRVWTLLHVPCITLPCFQGPNGLPMGLQVVGRRGADAALLAAARRIEQSLG
jgi:Asp-tRNA(Asn)/Glu-tRNA(Gln) amidotransferase A subunit family amidase